MTPDHIRAEVEKVRMFAKAVYDEAAHSTEDDLHKGLLRAIAAGAVHDPRLCAVLALQTQAIAFARWAA